MKGRLGFFDLDDRYEQLRKSGDPLEKLSQVVNFEAFNWLPARISLNITPQLALSSSQRRVQPKNQT